MKFSLVVLVCMAACHSAKQKAYEELAGHLNPILETMRPAATRIAGLDPSAHDEIIKACMSADESLWKLRDIHFDGDDVDTLPKRDRLSTTAAGLVDDRQLVCRDLPAHRLEPCSKWCRDEWGYMTETVEVLRAAAKREGVTIVSLKP